MISKGEREWLETDGLGGYAMGTAAGINRRKYHGLLVRAQTPPTQRIMLLNQLDVEVEIDGTSYPLCSHEFDHTVLHPDGVSRLTAFEADPWPKWTYRLSEGVEVLYELFIRRGKPGVYCRWSLQGKSEFPAALKVRPLLSGRDHHHEHRYNAEFNFGSTVSRRRVSWSPYYGVPTIVALSNGQFESYPQWYYNFHYSVEAERGLESQEDLASPGEFSFDLQSEDAFLILSVDDALGKEQSAKRGFERAAESERKRRAEFSEPEFRSVDAYLVEGENRHSIVAGYPWFTDWGRDAFIALRGLCLSTGRFGDAEKVLLSWAETVSEGMIPNLFPDSGGGACYNSVDASLWFVVCAAEFLERHKEQVGKAPKRTTKKALLEACAQILEGYEQGTRYGIRAEDDGLLAIGEPGSQLTWMDASVNGRPITSRIGKPVEVQALWLNALALGSALMKLGKKRLFTKGLKSFEKRFWNEEKRCLYDVVDCGHEAGLVDDGIRPNQIFAVGGLPRQLLEGEKARAVVDCVERVLWTPVGLRSLAPGSYGYASHYFGSTEKRDASYHQGTVWCWPIGAFVEAWVRVQGDSEQTRAEARERFFQPLEQHCQEAGIYHLSEIFDAEAPHIPRGTPFQAWSLGEYLRLKMDVLS